MKSNSPSPIATTGSQQKIATPVQSQSPYLKAILNGAISALGSSRMIRLMDDKTAASRYIKESRLLRG
jgi:hypothetical protein